MIVCIYVYPWQGGIVLNNNTFVNNSAITINKVLVGSASVMQISGFFTTVYSIKNMFYQNFCEYAAVIGIFYGTLRD